MTVQGRDCAITLKTKYREMGLPYSEETIREAVSLLTEQAPIEGDGVCGTIRKSTGVIGCVVTPLTIETAPLLLVLALGQAGQPVYVSETRNLYRHSVQLLPSENSMRFDLIQERGAVRMLYENCKITGFELRIHQDEAIKLKLDICSPEGELGEYGPVSYPYAKLAETNNGERFSSDSVTYKINDREYKNIYSLTISTRKEDGTKTEIWIHRILDKDCDPPSIIENFTISAQLYRNKYERREYGLFRLSLSRLVLMSDETTINSSGTVIGPLRYYCVGGLSAEVFTNTGEELV
jgi:hypothetical protein